MAKVFKFTDKQAELLGESVLCKIYKDRDVIEMITNNNARMALQKEIEKLNEILTILAQEE